MNEKTENQNPEVTENEEIKSAEDLAVEEAEAALAAEEAEDKGETKDDESAEFEAIEGQTDDEVKPSEAEENKDDKAEGKGADDRTVPLAALQETRGKLDEANLRAARLEGELAATRKPVEEPDPEPTPQERIAAIRERKVANAKKFDDGDIDAVEMEKGRQELDDAERAIHEETVKAPVAPTTQLDATIEQNLVRLESEFPIIGAISQGEMKGFVEQAIRRSETDGKPFGSGALETIRLHNEAAAIAHGHYAQFYKPKEEPKPDGEKSGDPSQKLDGLSDKAKALSDKMDLAAKHPPDINQIGSAAEGTLSDEQIDAKMAGMSESERIEFLDQMPGLAKRLTGI